MSALVTFTAYANPGLATRFLASPARQGDVAFWGGVCAALDVSAAQRDRLRGLLRDLTRQSEQLGAAERHLLGAIKVDNSAEDSGTLRSGCWMVVNLGATGCTLAAGWPVQPAARLGILLACTASPRAGQCLLHRQRGLHSLAPWRLSAPGLDQPASSRVSGSHATAGVAQSKLPGCRAHLTPQHLCRPVSSR